MKILITGYTTRMFGSKFVRGDYKTFSYLLEDILVEMGHHVVKRKILIGETLYDEFDFAFLGVAPLSSITSGRVPETHYAMKQMRGRHAVYADDWSFCGYGNSVRYTLDRWDGYLKYRKFPYSEQILEETRQSLESMMNFEEANNAPILAPMFPWGDHKFLLRGNYRAPLVTIDPSIYLEYPTVEIPAVKKRQWVMAALSDHTPWIKKQGFKLPVLYVGNKRMENTQVLTEHQVIQLFAESFGVLSTGYPSAGSGWWRTRYLNAVWAESIIYSDPLDALEMGIYHQNTVEQLENLTDFEYSELAKNQASWLMKNISQKDTIKTIMERLMKK